MGLEDDDRAALRFGGNMRTAVSAAITFSSGGGHNRRKPGHPPSLRPARSGAAPPSKSANASSTASGGARLDGGQQSRRGIERHMPAGHGQPHRARGRSPSAAPWPRPGCRVAPVEQCTRQVRAGAAVPKHQFPVLRCVRPAPPHRDRSGTDHQRPARLEPLGERVEHVDIGLLGAEEIRWSASILVTTAISSRYCTNEPSLSSASATKYGPLPWWALVPRSAEIAADGERRIETAVLQRDGGRRGRGGLTRGPGDHQRPVTGHQLGKHHRPRRMMRIPVAAPPGSGWSSGWPHGW